MALYLCVALNLCVALYLCAALYLCVASSSVTCGPFPPVMNSASAIQRPSEEVAIALIIRTDGLGSLILPRKEASTLCGRAGTLMEGRHLQEAVNPHLQSVPNPM